MANENENISSIPYAAYESTMEREDRKHKRNFIIILVLIVALLATNGFWIYYENQFEDVVTTETVTQNGEVDGNGNVLLNNGGDLNYGNESESNDN